jgi:hypothetical protein
LEVAGTGAYGSFNQAPHRSIKDYMMINNARIAFGPAALSRFTQIIEEVTVDLVGDGLAAELVRSDEMRRKLAQRLLGFARLWWTDTQIKQLLLRTVRNQISVSRRPQREWRTQQSQSAHGNGDGDRSR